MRKIIRVTAPGSLEGRFKNIGLSHEENIFKWNFKYITYINGQAASIPNCKDSLKMNSWPIRCFTKERAQTYPAASTWYFVGDLRAIKLRLLGQKGIFQSF